MKRSLQSQLESYLLRTFGMKTPAPYDKSDPLVFDFTKRNDFDEWYYSVSGGKPEDWEVIAVAVDAFVEGWHSRGDDA